MSYYLPRLFFLARVHACAHARTCASTWVHATEWRADATLSYQPSPLPSFDAGSFFCSVLYLPSFVALGLSGTFCLCRPSRLESTDATGPATPCFLQSFCRFEVSSSHLHGEHLTHTIAPRPRMVTFIIDLTGPEDVQIFNQISWVFLVFFLNEINVLISRLSQEIVLPDRKRLSQTCEGLRQFL